MRFFTYESIKVRKEKGKEVCTKDVLRKKGESKKGKRSMYERFCK